MYFKNQIETLFFIIFSEIYVLMLWIYSNKSVLFLATFFAILAITASIGAFYSINLANKKNDYKKIYQKYKYLGLFCHYHHLLMGCFYATLCYKIGPDVLPWFPTIVVIAAILYAHGRYFFDNNLQEIVQFRPI